MTGYLIGAKAYPLSENPEFPIHPIFIRTIEYHSCLNPQCGHQWQIPEASEKEKAPKKT